MSASTIDRPVWRSFAPRFVANAAAHVRKGGFSALIDKKGRIKVLLPRTRAGALTEMSEWALLALEIRRWGSARNGPARGLAAVRIKPGDCGVIRGWCERDSTHPGSTHRISLDCLACGACCRDNHVVLEPPDLSVWKRAGRPELSGPPYTRRSRGTVVLRLTPSGRCVHLGPKNYCSIYPLRPTNCSAFPVGAEPCLAAREDTLGLVD